MIKFFEGTSGSTPRRRRRCLSCGETEEYYINKFVTEQKSLASREKIDDPSRFTI